MSVLFIILSILFIICTLALVTIILMQKKRSAGLGGLSGMGGSQTYWDRNKGRSLEGVLEKYTKVGGVLFFILSLALCIIK
ncbi:MAG: preprotein translocase subunit SecG [Clostridiales bacterium]|nr:preprotein translocase subunit SecG [Clostridiales bacterium]